MSVTTVSVSFPTGIKPAKSMSDMVSTIRTEIQARDMVDNLESTWTGQCSILAANAMAGKSFDSYDDAAKVINSVLKDLRDNVVAAIAADEETAKTEFAGPDLADRLARYTVERKKVYNSLTSMKSVLTKAMKMGDSILGVVDDGGHIMFRGNGDPRAKTELQNLIKAAKKAGTPDVTDFERAMRSGATFARHLASLSESERGIILTEFNKKLSEAVADEDGEYEELDEAA